MVFFIRLPRTTGAQFAEATHRQIGVLIVDTGKSKALAERKSLCEIVHRRDLQRFAARRYAFFARTDLNCFSRLAELYDTAH
ncbi:MAG: hypothetical protein ABI461_02280, partial [Polyangiaceae bacterium]